ncbi:hypothetical protein K450DRAFT_258513 [Umbelopsis ramanniana AG]|uniref:PH domain-containing protein n=1 Tax=Umbelopsis ramanniana AG TaxID=1314678 RepID=A0AAD5HBE6_UMBRA|nr:uncharacterized protein K450DRAFT_258513 [Umbelopsis ramanniana AG]KAI8576108.1 hypothetical protein K450DRAFT_258513 [Umbelopsis ramanniana AG]
MHSSDDDDIPVAIAARQHAARVLTSRGDHTNLSRAKTMASHSTSNSQNGLARRKTEHHHRRRDLASDAPPKSNIPSDSDTSGLMRGRSTTRTHKSHTAENSGKSGTHDVQSDLHKLQLAAVHKVASRIYIYDSSRYVNMQLTSLMTTAMVLESLRERSVIDNEQSWTLFELANKVGVERPLRDWEIVTDVLSTWDQDEKNALLIKQYAYKSTLTSASILNQSDFMPPNGPLHFQYKKGKWNKRFFAVRENGIYCGRDSKKLGDTPLINLSNVDVYTLMVPMKKDPTAYGFALKAQEKAKIFENPEDFVFYFCAETMEIMRYWVLCLRQCKNLAAYASDPERVLHPLRPVELPPLPQSVIQKVLSPSTSASLLEQQSLDHKTSSEDSVGGAAKVHRSATLMDRQTNVNRPEGQGKATVRRYKSTHELSSSIRHNAETRMQQESKHRVADMPHSKPPIPRASKSTGTRRAGPLPRSLDQSLESVRVAQLDEKRLFDKAALLSLDDRSTPASPHDDGGTLVKLDNEVQFVEGSLLQQASETGGTRGRSKSISRDNHMARSQSRSRHAHDTRDASSSTSRSKSLRRKPTVRDIDRDAETQPPLPTTTGEEGPLLQLDLTPEASHTQSLRNRQVKPLITF